MARQQSAVEVNAFVKGLITEASALTFPDNAAIDIKNLVLNRDGSISRRLGMDYEDGYAEIDSQQSVDVSFATSSFVWKNPGGYADQEIAVVQTGPIINFFDSSSLPLSGSLIQTHNLSTDPTTRMSFTAVDGILVVAEGSGTIYAFDYDGSSVNPSTGRLLIRDMFGVEDKLSGTDLLSGSGLALRPSSLTDNHVYNLRNQTFAQARWVNDQEVLKDPIQGFSSSYIKHYSSTAFPANSDNLVTYLYADANDSDNRNARRYFAEDAVLNPLGTNRAPVGYFIIDALNRGASRVQQLVVLASQYPALVYTPTSLPTDSTPGGATVVATYSGRVFYGGFSSQVVGGDSESPRLTSYILFSRLIQKISDIYKCYQDGDPTSSETPDLVDTDGGFIRLDGAYNIQYMINVGDALMVVAENGVWKVTGGSGYGFKATDYLVSKVTEHGSISANSVVLVDNTFMYWADDGIYHVAQNQYGDWAANNLTTTTVQTLFDNIPYTSKRYCQGMYDSYQRRVRWLYNNTLESSDSSTELVLDVGLSAFYLTEIPVMEDPYPRPLAMLKVPPYETVSSQNTVLDENGNTVIDTAGDTVTVAATVIDSSLSEIYYIVAARAQAGTVRYTFSLYRDSTWHDWMSYDNTGVDASGYIVTGWTGMGDFQRQKQVSYLTVYSLKTETGFDTSYNPIGSSSIKVQGQWNWTNSAEAGKWTQEFQAYRHRRLWLPSSSSDGFDDGEYVVTTKNKLRGRGRVLSLKFSTEEDYNFHLLGWSYLAGINGSP